MISLGTKPADDATTVRAKVAKARAAQKVIAGVLLQSVFSLQIQNL
jgi:hypothetical protein